MCPYRKCHTEILKSIEELESMDSSQEVPHDLPEHSDNPFINRNLVNGILGYRYENKTDGMTIIYTSLEAKTFCKLMQIHPIKK